VACGEHGRTKSKESKESNQVEGLLPIYASAHSRIYSFTHLLIHAFTHSRIYSFTHLLIHESRNCVNPHLKSLEPAAFLIYFLLTSGWHYGIIPTLVKQLLKEHILNVSQEYPLNKQYEGQILWPISIGPKEFFCEYRYSKMV